MISRLQGSFAAAATKDPAREAAIVKFLQFMTEPKNVQRIQEISVLSSLSKPMLSLPTTSRSSSTISQPA